ncbi:MAG: 50S ribosomal protein L34 [Parcubacteria group bacterium]
MKITTYRPKKGKRKKKHGFRKRMQTASGRNVVAHRRNKKRSKLTA